MRIIHWNISYNAKKELIAAKLSDDLLREDTVICLLEVTKTTYTYLREEIGDRYRFVYSLDYRLPGDYDSKGRKLGVLIIVPVNYRVINCGVFRRAPYPDRTAFVILQDEAGRFLRILSLHSVAGCNFLRGKSVQFDSFAEIVKSFTPDIVTIDANEPRIDHWDINQMEFFDNRDKGKGAKTFFTSIAENGMTDAYSCVYDKNSFVPGEYLATSHLVSRGEKRERRYDFIFVHSGCFKVRECSYSYEEARQASADHAIVRAELEIMNKEGELYHEVSSKETIIQERMSVCRFWHGEDKCDKQVASYERLWVNLIDEDPEYLQYLINGYIQRGLELFSLDDGVPIGLKALLFNRYEHWSSGYEDIVGGFKNWYFSDYLCQKEKAHIIEST